MKLPWSHKFGFRCGRDGQRFYVRILLGVFLIYACKDWEYIPMYGRRVSQISFGWIPLDIEPGGLVKTWSPYQRFYDVFQEPL